MSDYRPRPNDHLVEPLFGGLQAAHEPARHRSRRGWVTLVLLLGSLMVVAWLLVLL